MALAKTVLITGGAGFIGSHLVDNLLQDNWSVTIVDNFDSFYDPAEKRSNISAHMSNSQFNLVEADIRQANELTSLCTGDYSVVVHLAARAGVRPSIDNPTLYQDVNVAGTQNVLELARERGVSLFIFGSSSSVYGINENVPWSEEDQVLLPISPYASTKISGELMGHVYSHLYGIRFISLRFFTVYGPRQRPDLAIRKFAQLLAEGKKIPMYGNGQSRRDYTHVFDIVDGIRAAMLYDDSKYAVFNLGNNETVSLAELIEVLEQAMQVDAKVERLDSQPGDVHQTWADLQRSRSILGYRPKIKFRDGIADFISSLS